MNDAAKTANDAEPSEERRVKVRDCDSLDGFLRHCGPAVGGAVLAAHVVAMYTGADGLLVNEEEILKSMRLAGVRDWNRARKAFALKLNVTYELWHERDDLYGSVECGPSQTMHELKLAIARRECVRADRLSAMPPHESLRDWTPLCGAFGPPDLLYKPSHMHASVAFSTARVVDLSELFNRLR